MYKILVHKIRKNRFYLQIITYLFFYLNTSVFHLSFMMLCGGRCCFLLCVPVEDIGKNDSDNLVVSKMGKERTPCPFLVSDNIAVDPTSIQHANLSF